MMLKYYFLKIIITMIERQQSKNSICGIALANMLLFNMQTTFAISATEKVPRYI